MIVSSIFRFIIITVVVINLGELNLYHHHYHQVLAVPLEKQQQNKLLTSANEPIKTTNSNVYGADNDSTNQNQNGGQQQQQQPQTQQQQEQNPQSINRGYNQGYSYNTGIKPYRTGYTYFQPFGDNVQNQNNGNNGNGDNNTNQELPIELPNFFGIDPKQLGPVRVIQNRNLPLDENGIPILDQIHIPENTNENQNGNNNNNNNNNVNIINQQQQQQTKPPPPPPMPPVEVPVNPNEFTDFNLNNLLSGNNNNNNNNIINNNNNNNNNNGLGMFDFSPPSTSNFNFARPGTAGADQSDYNRLDDFAGNLNNFDTYLGDDPSLMMDGNMDMNGVNGNNNNGNNNGLAGFGLGGQQVPSEIVNLNNAFGTGGGISNNNQANGGNIQNNNGATNLNDILNQFGTPNTNTNTNANMNTNSRSSSNDVNQIFPFLL